MFNEGDDKLNELEFENFHMSSSFSIDNRLDLRSSFSKFACKLSRSTDNCLQGEI